MSRCENNIKMNSREIGQGYGLDLSGSESVKMWPAIFITVINFRASKHFGKFLNSVATVGVSRRTRIHVVS
jgi:hypothetical protein